MMRARTRGVPQASQRGAAVLLALFVVTLATVLVTGLFWNQFVLIRTVGNQQDEVQSRLLLKGAQDWARAILQDQTHPSYDALSDPWAQPLARTRLDELGETAPLASQATLEGGIEDAQARFNLHNLVDGAGNVNPVQLAVLDKLATLLAAPPGTARVIATYLAQCYTLPPPPNGAPAQGAVAPGHPLPPVLPDDLAGVPGLDPAAAALLAPFVILLDQPNTPVNFNTASPEMMAASVPELTMSDALSLAAERDRAYFTNVGDIQNRAHGHGGFSTANVATASRYFIVRGTVRLNRAASHLQALVRRGGTAAQVGVDILWERDS